MGRDFERGTRFSTRRSNDRTAVRFAHLISRIIRNGAIYLRYTYAITCHSGSCYLFQGAIKSRAEIIRMNQKRDRTDIPCFLSLVHFTYKLHSICAIRVYTFSRSSLHFYARLASRENDIRAFSNLPYTSRRRNLEFYTNEIGVHRSTVYAYRLRVSLFISFLSFFYAFSTGRIYVRRENGENREFVFFFFLFFFSTLQMLGFCVILPG